MRNYILIILLTAFSARAGLSRIEALSMIETGDNDLAVGQAGEVSRYQIKPWIWRLYSQSSAYTDQSRSRCVAEMHLTGLSAYFQKRTRRQPTDFDIYVLWNAGPTYYSRIGFSRARVHPVVRERARRFANLCQQTLPNVAKTVDKPRDAAESTRPADQRSTVQDSKPAEADRLWPILSESRPVPLANPMLPVLPLTPERAGASPLKQQPMFAIGGVRVD